MRRCGASPISRTACSKNTRRVHRLPFIDMAAEFPQDPALVGDAIHLEVPRAGAAGVDLSAAPDTDDRGAAGGRTAASRVPAVETRAPRVRSAATADLRSTSFGRIATDAVHPTGAARVEAVAPLHRAAPGRNGRPTAASPVVERVPAPRHARARRRGRRAPSVDALVGRAAARALLPFARRSRAPGRRRFARDTRTA